MIKNKILFLSLLLIVGVSGCKKQLDVGNPNSPTLAANVNSESGLIAFAQGAVYINGFASSNAYNWLGSSYFSLNYGYSELLGDMVGSDEANELVSQINIPSYVILDNGTQFPTTGPNTSQTSTLRTENTRAATSAGYNAFYYQWFNMYALNGSCNIALAILPTITLSGDTTAVANTIKAWCYFWKGYAYSVIGSQYYSGVVIDSASATAGNGTSNQFLIKDSIISRSNYWYNQAAAALALIPSGSTDYTTVLGELIPAFCQTTPHGGVLTPAMWIDNINTLLARNLLESKLAPYVNSNLNASIAGSSMQAMSASDWQNVLALATKGIQNGDYVFTGTSIAANGFYNATTGTASLLSAGPNSNTVFKISMRFIQDFNAGDQRLALDFYDSLPPYLSDYYSAAYSLTDLPNGNPAVYNYGDVTVGDYELFIAGSYEENELMLAEANLRLGNTNTGLQYVDAVRTYQGAGVASVATAGLTPAQAYHELVKERRVALFDRGVSFWDARRWGWTYDISKGGGSYGNTLITSADVTNTNVTIDFDFLDFWDVPEDEVLLNPPSAGSAAVVNPNF